MMPRPYLRGAFLLASVRAASKRTPPLPVLALVQDQEEHQDQQRLDRRDGEGHQRRQQRAHDGSQVGHDVQYAGDDPEGYRQRDPQKPEAQPSSSAHKQRYDGRADNPAPQPGLDGVDDLPGSSSPLWG